MPGVWKVAISTGVWRLRGRGVCFKVFKEFREVFLWLRLRVSRQRVLVRKIHN